MNPSPHPHSVPPLPQSSAAVSDGVAGRAPAADAVRVRDLRVTAPGRGLRPHGPVLLRDIDLRAPLGQMTVLVGSNGAGKTTLLRTLIGAIAPARGTIELLGQPMSGPEDRLPARAAVVPDAPDLPEGMSAAKLAALAAGVRPGFDPRRFRALLADFRVPGSRAAEKLSEGQRTLLSVAFALAADPELIILDEPFARLDPLARPELMDVLRDHLAADERRSILLSSHDLEDLDRAADALAVLHDGRIVLQGQVDDLLEEHLHATVPAGVADGLLRGSRPAAGGREGLVRLEDAAGMPPSAVIRPPQLRELVSMTLREHRAAAARGDRS